MLLKEETIFVRNGNFAKEDIYRDEKSITIEPEQKIEEINFNRDNITLIIINFPLFSDGRGFSLAKKLRLNGFRGILRARGHIIADQYPLLLRCGFDEVEISIQLSKRIPEQQWKNALKRIKNTYLERLQG